MIINFDDLSDLTKEQREIIESFDKEQNISHGIGKELHDQLMPIILKVLDDKIQDCENKKISSEIYNESIQLALMNICSNLIAFYAHAICASIIEEEEDLPLEKIIDDSIEIAIEQIIPGIKLSIKELLEKK
ncbi:MAG: hypothetical protein ACP5N7_01020 [Candidatus Pacearchaeota archaeon]